MDCGAHKLHQSFHGLTIISTSTLSLAIHTDKRKKNEVERKKRKLRSFFPRKKQFHLLKFVGTF